MKSITSVIERGKRAVARRFIARGLILIYHRVTEEQSDPWRLSVTPDHFADQLQTLRGLGVRVVHVSQLARELADGRSQRGTVALSFDDGYHDNLEFARPLLERFEVPATLFATSGYIGGREEFWWDTLERIFLQPGRLPQILELTLSDRLQRWDLGTDADLTGIGAAKLNSWKPFDQPPTVRHRIHDELWQLLVKMPPAERSQAVAQLLDWAEVPRTPRQSHRPLTAEELRSLGHDGLVEIGAHSVTHPHLGVMPKAVRKQELADSKAQLEEMLGRPVRGFCYPQGGSSPEVQQEARAAGYEFACGSAYQAVTARSDPFHLPRVSARDWEGPRLRSLIAHHLSI